MSSHVGEVMTRNVVSVRKHAQFKDIIQVMRNRHFSAFPVVDADDLKRLPVVNDEGTLVGIVSRVDLLGVYDRPDSEIRTEILKQVIETGFLLDSLAFKVTVTAGLVTVAGSVDREPVALSLLAAVKNVDGVVAVRDRLNYPRD